MVKLIISAVWICAVTLAAAYGAVVWKSDQAAGCGRKTKEHLESKKTRPIDVPMIADGNVEGYVVAQFVYTTDAASSKDVSVPPDVFLLDEAFRSLYSDPKLDFRHLEKYDLTGLTKNLVQKVNERLKADVVKDVLVEEFNYVSKQDISK